MHGIRFESSAGVKRLVGGLVFGFLLGTAGAGHAQGTAAAPTFAKDVAGILQEKCQTCHR